MNNFTQKWERVKGCDPLLLQGEREKSGTDRFSGAAITNVSQNKPEQQKIIDELNVTQAGRGRASYRVVSVTPLPEYCLFVSFADGRRVIYDVKEDFNAPGFDSLQGADELFNQVQVDESGLVVYWNEYADLPSELIYKHGQEVHK